LNIADNLFKAEERESQIKKEVRERVRRILKLIRQNREKSE
jgi:hypothetical protein